ncbi:MAG: glycosyltransferase family 4 protein [Xanthomonadales bacterium]|nr:glycosyltransferase family 4 protein [Xanthomonadales bacterium]
MSQRITLLMLSRMGQGDGGRETWLSNFLDEIARQSRDVTFDIIHQRADTPTLLDVPSRRDIVASIRQIDRRWLWCPVSVELLIRLAFSGGWIEPGARIAGIGGLAEAIAVMLLTPFRGRKRRMMWLRTIYTREKSAQLPGPTRRMALALETFVLHRFGLVLANGEDTAAFYRGLDIPVEVVPNAIPLAKWSMSPPPETAPLRVGFIGRLTEVKGIFAFLEAVEYCQQDWPGAFRFHIAGDGPARAAVDMLATRAPMTVHGQLDNLATRNVVADVDVCVALTLSSADLGGGGISNALLEQMAAQRIIVAWDNDIFLQVLDGRSAYLVPQGDARTLADTLFHIANHRNEALEKATNARSLAQDFSIEAHVDRFFSIIGNHEDWCR